MSQDHAYALPVGYRLEEYRIERVLGIRGTQIPQIIVPRDAANNGPRALAARLRDTYLKNLKITAERFKPKVAGLRDSRAFRAGAAVTEWDVAVMVSFHPLSVAPLLRVHGHCFLV